ncbi:response regulator transcription factor [Arcobacter sp. FWKO B]|uniref:response regulator transcription factor n=1 Tax=Arcobacter sp. FWKO B TaxID=2593672 RepID=UPI0018A3BC4C|nr:response regulator transcription factor [Arcobacter sp. FWKO B]QOG11828.1 response regulator transcription factor [Arcobacter sp. FWKO B]
MTGTKILFLEDDILYQESIKDILEEEHYIVESCKNGQEFLNKIFDNVYDLYIIDINVPKVNGFEIMRMLKEYNDKTMKLVLTSVPNSIIQSFKSGCDSFLSKNTDLDEILIRIKSLIKRTYHTYDEYIKITDNISYDYFNKQLYDGSRKVELETRALNVLDYLIKNRGEFISTIELEKNIYPCNSESKSGVIRYHIWNLRKAIGKDLIQSKKCSGYKLRLPV